MSSKNEISKILEAMSADEILQYFENNRIEKIRTHGNSAVITLPKSWLHKLNWKTGEQVKATLNGDNITISKQLRIDREAQSDRKVR